MQQSPHQGLLIHHINKDEITDIATLFKCYYRFSPIYTTVPDGPAKVKSCASCNWYAQGQTHMHMQASPVEIQA